MADPAAEKRKQESENEKTKEKQDAQNRFYWENFSREMQRRG